MLNYRKILAWHRSAAAADTSTTSQSPDSSGSSDAHQLEVHLQKQYIDKKLDSGLVRIWQDVQTKIRVLVQASNLADFSIDNFIRFLDTIHKLIQVGKEFSGSNAETLQESLKKQCLSYFQAYHTSRLDELKTHLENEGWALCPVKLNFSVRSLVEFAHLKATKSPSKKSVAGESSFFKQYWDQKTPFDECLNEARAEEDILAGDADLDSATDSDDDLSEEQKLEILNENEGSATSTFSALKERKWVAPPARQGLCLANTTLMVLRLFGRYSHLMTLLHPIGEHILIGVKQLFDYYTFSVYKFFSADLPESEHATLDAQLLTYLHKIEKGILLETKIVSETDDKGTRTFREVSTGLVGHPSTPLGVDLARPEGNFALAERIVALESCLYLAQQISEHESALAQYPSQSQVLEALFSDQVSTVLSMRYSIYYGSLVSILDLEKLVPVIGKVAWDPKEVKSQHSGYVDIMLKQFQVRGLFRSADLNFLIVKQALYVNTFSIV